MSVLTSETDLLSKKHIYFSEYMDLAMLWLVRFSE